MEQDTCGEGEGAINNPAGDVHAEINLQDVVGLEEDFWAAGVGRPVCADVVQT